MLKRILVLLLGLLFATYAWAGTFKKIIVFGDSLSDNGNLYELMNGTFPKTPPFYKGRFSNGPVWVEHLAKYVSAKHADEVLADFAVAGATMLCDSDYYAFNMVDCVATQTELFETAALDWLPSWWPEWLGKKIDYTHFLFIIWAGSNDYFNIVYQAAYQKQRGLTPEELKDRPTKVIQNLRQRLETLIADGGKYFVIPTTTDLGFTPEARKYDQVLSGARANLHQLATTHNVLLTEMITELQSKYKKKGVVIIPIDINQLYQRIMQNPELSGISNITDPCLDDNKNLIKTQAPMALGGSRLREDEALTFIKNRPDLRVALEAQGNTSALFGTSALTGNSSCDSKLFWDNIHPTKKAHELLGQYAYQTIQSYGVTYKK